MNGIIITSLEGGILFYEKSYITNYGLGSQEVNALQLSSSLYTVYRISQGENCEKSGLHWIRKGDTKIVFLTIDVANALVTVFMDSGISDKQCNLIMGKVSECMSRNQELIENPMKSSSKKTLRAELITMQIDVATSMLRDLCMHSSVEKLFIVQLELKSTFDDWSKLQNATQPAATIVASIGTPSSKSAIAMSDSTNTQNRNQVISSSSERMLPPLVMITTPVKPTRSNSFTQLFRRLIPRFDTRTASPTASGASSSGVGADGIAAARQSGYRIFSATRISENDSPLPVNQLLTFLDRHFLSIPATICVGPSENMLLYSVASDEAAFRIEILGSPIDSELIHAGAEWKINLKDETIVGTNSSAAAEFSFIVLRMGDILMISAIKSTSFETGTLKQVNKSNSVDLIVWSKGLLRNACDRQLML